MYGRVLGIWPSDGRGVTKQRALGPRVGFDSRYLLLKALGECLRRGSAELILPDGSKHWFFGEAPGPQAALEVRRPRFVTRLLRRGAIGFAEAYIDGDIETPDLAAFLTLAGLNQDAWRTVLDGKPMFRALQGLAPLLRPGGRRGAARNIAHHYDLGNDFYAAWLDDGLSYSAGLFAGPDEPLAAAQARKHRRLAALADLRPEHHLLEIGCGWGGFALFAAREIGCRVTATTISRKQFEFASALVQREGLGERIAVRRRDYRDTHGRHDRVVAIEMFEAVGERHWPCFFDTLARCLAPDGRAALQVITIDDALWPRYRRRTDFIQRHVFPGGFLPSPGALRRAIAAKGFACLDDNGHGPDYARTLTHWRANFEAAWPKIAALGHDTRFRRLWRYYLTYCTVGFELGRLDVRQVALRPR